MDLTLVRDYTDAGCTLGELHAGELTLQTLELSWRPLPPPALCGRPDLSCVPAGAYDLVPHDSPRHPHTWALVAPGLGVFHDLADVPGDCGFARTDVLIHVANFTNDLLGCIGVGRTRIKARLGYWWISSSRDSFAALQKILPWTTGHTLTISYASGVAPE